MTARYTCLYPRCRWKFDPTSISFLDDDAVALEVEREIRNHLDLEHSCWTIEELQRMRSEQQLKQLFGPIF